MLDFDEMLVKVKDSQVKKYLKEAITSYTVGNYRSAIITVWIASMFNLVNKFELLVHEREQSAVDKWKKLKPKIEDHSNWEKALIDAAKDVEMISKYEFDTLVELSKTRNRYAHPSFNEVGVLFDPTPEEVRYFIRTLYDVVLSQPAQLGAFYVNQLIESLKTPAWKVKLKNISNEFLQEKEFIFKEIQKINSRQYPRLIKQLLKSLDAPEDQQHRENIFCFIMNMWTTTSNVEIQQDIASYFNNCLVNEIQDIELISNILRYSECLNYLSKNAQKIVKRFVIKDILNPSIPPIYYKNFFVASDIVKVAEEVLDEMPNLLEHSKSLPYEKIDFIYNSKLGFYKNIFGIKFHKIFAEVVICSTTRVLKSGDWNRINHIISRIEESDLWTMTTEVSELDREEFIYALIESLMISAWKVKDLLKYTNYPTIPTPILLLFIIQWHKYVGQEEKNMKNSIKYLEYYIRIAHYYSEKTGDESIVHDFIGRIFDFSKNDQKSSERISNLEFDERTDDELSRFWIKISTISNL